MKLFIQYWKTILWVIVIFFLSTLQIPNVPSVPLFNIPNFDKFVHFTLYSILLTAWSVDYFKCTLKFNKRRFLIIILSSISYGLIMEIIQKVVVQNRSGDIFDALANTIGVLVAFLLFRYIHPYRKTILIIFAKSWL